MLGNQLWIFFDHLFGERLGFGVTLLLAREFCKALVQQLTPICDEQLWIQNFDVVNEIFTTLPVVVTLVVMFFHYREVDFARNSVQFWRNSAQLF